MARHTANSTGLGLIGLTILLLVLSVCTMVLDYQKKIPGLRNLIQETFTIPLKTASAWPSQLQDNISHFFVEKKLLKEENKKLKKEILWLKAGLANQTILEAELRRLKNLFDSNMIQTKPVLLVEVIDTQIDANKHQIEISKGKSSNLSEGQIATDEHGVVGQITSLFKHTAIISLITDEHQRVPVFIQRNNLRLMLRGSGNLNELEIEFATQDADIRVGDKLITSGLGKRYPKGYGVATITEVKQSPLNEFLQIKAKPLARLDKVLEVLLISPKVSSKGMEDNIKSSEKQHAQE
ncbi:MAG: rod shape-determining protein MreC [Gammaproteobacteria bacterium]|nr:MAG: rod shape-determining protein MreC [Gammaproteobacteria bacterium]